MRSPLVAIVIGFDGEEKRGLAMGALRALAACAGGWVGTSRLQDPHSDVPDESHSTVTITTVLGGRFLRLDYDWAYRGAPQQGSLLIGHETPESAVTAQWIDTWHMGDKVMSCRGTVEEDGAISVRGSYAAPPGPDWGWRTVITPGAQRLRLVMYNITPDGKEELAVEGEYARAP
jgi:hypothetical protein